MAVFRFQIDVHYKNPDKKENSFIYDLLLKPDSNYGHYKQQTLFFVRPSRDWKKTLLQGGAVSSFYLLSFFFLLFIRIRLHDD